MSYYLGIDTSNYTTSAAVFDSGTGKVVHRKKLLPVAEGSLGLKQSDMISQILRSCFCLPPFLAAVGCFKYPRNA